MTNAQNTPDKDIEKGKKNQQITIDLRTQSYKAFVDFQMRQRHAPAFLADFLGGTNANAHRTWYISFLQNDDRFKSLAPVESDPKKDENLKAINKLDLRAAMKNYVERYAISYASMRNAVFQTMESVYVIDPKKKKALEEEISELDLGELERLLGRARIDAFARKYKLELKEEQEVMSLIEQLELDGKRFTPAQKAALKQLSRRHSPLDAEEAKRILSLFAKEDDRKKLLSLVMPTISLQELIDVGIITKQQARAKLANLLKTWAIEHIPVVDRERLANDVTFLENAEFSEIRIKTPDFPKETLDAIVESGHFLERFRHEANATYEVIAEEVSEALQDIPREVGLDKEGKAAPDFLNTLQESFDGKIIGLGLLGSDEHKKGKNPLYLVATAMIDKKPQQVSIRIENWNEYATEKRAQRPTIRVSFLSTHGGMVQRTGRPDSLTYKEFYSLLDALKSGSIMDEAGFTAKTDSNEIRVLGETDESGNLKKISNLKELNNELDLLDKDWSAHPIKVDSSFTTKMKDGSMQAFTITAIEGDRLFLSNGLDGSKEWPFWFADFVSRFRELSGRRIQSLGNPGDFLKAIQGNGAKKKKFEDVEFDASRKAFVFKNRKDDQQYSGIRYFSGRWKDKDGKDMDNVIEVVSAESGRVKIRIHDSVKEEKQKDGSMKMTAKNSSKEQWIGYQMLYTLLENYKATPVEADKDPIKPIESKDPHVHMHRGIFSSWMQWITLHDIMTGGKSLVKFIEHKLEHSSKLHSAKASLGLAKMIGMGKWNEEWLWELESQIQNDNKKLMDEELEKMGKINPPAKRQRYIYEMLMNKGAPDYHIQAAAISMLQKHGSLYVGKELAPLEGTWFFYKRLRGLSVDADVNQDHRFRKIQEDFKRNGISFREENVIIEYFKKYAAEDYPGTNPGIWRMVRDGWEKGVADEKKNGEDEVSRYGNLQPKLDHVINKFKSKEYAGGLWALEKIWGQGGSSKEMNMSGFLLAMSNIPDKLPDSLRGTWKQFLWGHLYPGILFMRSNEEQQLFREVVCTLARDSGDAKMRSACDDVMKTIKWNPDSPEVIEKLTKFWDAYGDDLATKLSISPKSPDIFLKKDQPGYEHYQTYFSKLSGMIGDNGFHTDKWEDENGTYCVDKSSYALVNADKYVGEILFQGGPGALVDKKENIEKFTQYIHAIDAIKNSSARTEEEKIILYKRYHKAILGRIIEALGAETYTKIAKWDINPEYVVELRNRGIFFPSRQEKGLLEWKDYDEQVRRGYEIFQHGGSISEIVEERVGHSLAEILSGETGLSRKKERAVREDVGRAA